MTKETSLNVAALAGVFLNMTDAEFAGILRSRGQQKVLADIKSIAGSALAQKEDDPHDYHKYIVGERTFEKVFKQNGIVNLSDMQAVLDAVEKALADAGK